MHKPCQKAHKNLLILNSSSLDSWDGNIHQIEENQGGLRTRQLGENTQDNIYPSCLCQSEFYLTRCAADAFPCHHSETLVHSAISCSSYQQKALGAPACWQQLTKAPASRQLVPPEEHYFKSQKSVTGFPESSRCALDDANGHLPGGSVLGSWSQFRGFLPLSPCHKQDFHSMLQ